LRFVCFWNEYYYYEMEKDEEREGTPKEAQEGSSLL
jgi:hypothetical protein